MNHVATRIIYGPITLLHCSVYYVLLRCTRKHILLRIMWLQMLTMNNSTIKRLLTGSKNFQLMVKWSWCNGLAIYSCMEFQFWQELFYLLKDEKEARFQFRSVQKVERAKLLEECTPLNFALT